jgi:hypothetical protein
VTVRKSASDPKRKRPYPRKVENLQKEGSFEALLFRLSPSSLHEGTNATRKDKHEVSTAWFHSVLCSTSCSELDILEDLFPFLVEILLGDESVILKAFHIC